MSRTITQLLGIYSEEVTEGEEKTYNYVDIVYNGKKKISKISLMPLRIDLVSYKTNVMKYFATIKYYNYDSHEAAFKCIYNNIK